jgi:hypothetical protein
MNARTTHATPWTLKSGTNRNQRRLRIEGKRLTALGLVKGVKLSRQMCRDGSMELNVVPEGWEGTGKRHTVAGTVDRPILDLSGKWVTEFMGSAERFIVRPIVVNQTVTPTSTLPVVTGLRITPIR